jgi:1-aminocyclopropane-1-carboxylate deaminase/D-cysteine desulfhydrase-like pyridoxal-dependent ACC family enzyme
MSSTIELFERFPAARAIPHVSLGQLPTPVQPMPRAGEELGVPGLYIKRDDLSGAEYGGNKVRKLEFILGDAQDKGFKDVLTMGAIGSHHVLATSIYARVLGMTPAAQHFPQPVTPHVLKNLRALASTRPELSLIGHPAQLPFEQFKARLDEWLERRPQTYYIAAGGSSAIGVIGYVSAAFELARQVKEGLMPEPDFLYVTTGTGGTFAGLVLGAKMAGLKTKVVGVRVVDKVVCNVPNMLRLANGCAELLRGYGLDGVPSLSAADVTLVDDYVGGGYGVATAAGEWCEEVFRRCEGIDLEVTYTAKTAAAIAGDRDRRGLKDKVVLYWHTLSSADLSARIAGADVAADLPAAYQGFFVEEGR